jgi:hypothetical protein
MKYCSKCGKEISEEAVICPGCGCPTDLYKSNVSTSNKTSGESGLTTATKVFMILGCVLNAFFYLIPLAWCIPMTVVYFRKVKYHEPIGTGFKVCSLLFVSLVGGILMLVDNDN